MARPSIRRLAGQFARRIRGSARASSVGAAVVVVALVAVLLGTALVSGGSPSGPATTGGAGIAGITATLEHPVSGIATAAASARDTVFDDAVQGSLLPVPTMRARALARLGADSRLVAVVLAGLLLAVIGRRPFTRRPVLLLVPATAGPGLRVRRRGPPPR